MTTTTQYRDMLRRQAMAHAHHARTGQPAIYQWDPWVYRCTACSNTRITPDEAADHLADAHDA